MNLAGLDFERIPKFSIPMRFFFAAPLFAFISALIIAFAGESMWLTRWHPATLTVTHAIVIGIISMIMCGAILQLLPVLAGKSLPQVSLISTLTLVSISMGTLSLMTAFLASMFGLNSDLFFSLAGGAFTLGFGGFIGTILWLIRQRNNVSVSINAMRLGFIAVLIVGIIASLLLADYLFVGQFNITKKLTDSHASWGLIGWVSLVIIGVSFQVLPMFHVAPAFPVWCTRYLPVFLFSVLLLHTLLTFVITQLTLTNTVILQVALSICVSLLKLGLIAYAITAMHCLFKRKRKIKDTSVRCWFIALSCLLFCCTVSLVMSVITIADPAAGDLLFRLGWSPLTLASVFIYGWVLSVIMAMIIKIIPFLAYLHLQRQCGFHMQAFALLPNMHTLLSKQRMQVLMYSHVFSLITLFMTLYNPAYYGLLALAIIVQFGYLLGLMLGVSYRYHVIAKEIDVALLT